MPFHRFSALLLALVLCLLPGCGERPISSRLVLSSMGVECSARPLTAVLEVIREEKNKTITVQGESFTALFSAAERQTGEQVYLGALQSIVFSGVPDGSTLREYLRTLLADGRLSPNAQIALCGDALSLYDGEALTGDSITALLTRQYTDSRRNGLKELLNLLEGTGRDGLIPWLTTAEGELRETGAIATGQSDYTAPEEPEEICLMLLGERPEMRYALSTGAGEASILLRRLTLSANADGSTSYSLEKKTDTTTVEKPTVTLTAEASVQSVDGNMTRETLEAALLDELQRRLAALNTQMSRTRSDLLGLSARAALCGHDLQNIPLGELRYTVHLVLRDPRGLLS